MAIKIIRHSRDEVGDFQKRVLIHIPIGYIMGIASVIPFLGYGLVQLFLKYERNEDLHTEDQAWKDIFGAIVGFVMAIFTVFGVGIWLLLELL